MSAPRAFRNERLYVRLTADEAEQVLRSANARGISVSDFVREAVLRRSGLWALVGRRALPLDAAAAVRQLTAVAAELRRLATIAQTSGTIPPAELRNCLADVQTTIAGFAT